jgi:uncharacterized protein
VAQRADLIELETLQLRSGEARKLDSEVHIDPIQLGGEPYVVDGGTVEARLDVSRTISGYALRLRFDAPMAGMCMRCVGEAMPVFSVDAREVDQPGEAEEFHSPYVEDELLDLSAWARDALVLAMPAQVICSEDCLGLCTVCGANLNEADPDEHRHESSGDPRWSKLRDLNLG